MDQLELTIAFLEGTLAITCIENSLIGYLRYLNLPYKSVYCCSFINLYDTINDFILNKEDYTKYYQLKRLQDITELIQLANVTFIESDSFENTMKILVNQTSASVPIMLHVDPTKLPNHGQILPWRDDHFVLAYRVENDVVYFLDDYPRRQFKMSIEELKNVYKGEVVLFQVIDKFNYNSYIKIIYEVLKNISKTSYKSYVKAPETLEELIFYRDAIGIIRISRRRVVSWLMWVNENFDISINNECFTCLEKLIGLLDQLYSTLEAYRLRGRINHQNTNNLFDEIISYETQWISQLTCNI